MSIPGKLAAVRAKLPRTIGEDGKGYGYTYATPEKVLGIIMPLLDEAGLMLTTSIDSLEHRTVTVRDKNGEHQEELFTLALTMTWHDVETGETLDIPWAGAGCNGQEQGFGSALTYAERYFFLKQFNLATGKDDPDAVKAHRMERPQPDKPEHTRELTAAERRINANALAEIREKIEIPADTLAKMEATAITQAPAIFARRLLDYVNRTTGENYPNLEAVK